MKRFHRTPTAIDQFPVPWSSILPSTLGNGTFTIKQSTSRFAPSEWLGVVSSHDNKNGFARLDWQESLHSALQLASKQGWGILVSGDAPWAQPVVHACKRLHVPHRTLTLATSSRNVRSKITFAISRANAKVEVDTCDCGVLELAVEQTPADGKIPIHDSATVFLSNRLFVVALRSGGKIARLLERRLSIEEIPAGSTYLSLATPQKSAVLLNQAIEWLDRGAVGWLNTKPTPAVLNATSQAARSQCRTSDGSPTSLTHQPIFPMRLLRSTATKFFVHCTRARRGPWPDQSIAQFHDELLQQPWDEQPTAFLTLQRILKQQRLISTNQFRRGKTETVCFAEKELSELLAMRRFQSHLARWDWEPYGILIDREWLQSQGTKQVRYIDREAATQTSVDELPFCQVVSSEEGAIDWREEQEWRIAGDVRLNPIPFSKAIVFVPTQKEALVIQPFSRWPIAICSESSLNPLATQHH